MQDKIEKMGFLERATLFKQAVEKAQKRYKILLDAGYIHAWDDDDNLIVNDSLGTNRIYYSNL